MGFIGFKNIKSVCLVSKNLIKFSMSLHIREKKNPSGSVSIVIIDRKDRRYKVIETIGCAKNDIEKEILLDIAQIRIKELNKQMYPTLFDIFEDDKDELNFINLSNNQLIPVGDELIYGELFRQLGCNNIDLDYKNLKLFKELVISRLLYPGSKLYLIDYLNYFKKENIDKNKIYRFLDKLYKIDLKEQVEKCIFNHTLKIMNNQIFITFYDITTIYFESESEDDLRRIGFSKDGKIARPQILLGLYTTLEGYPLSFEVYEGNKYEGHTLIDILKKFQDKFKLKNKPIVVADRGMLTNANIAYLENNGYKYILAYKIKNAKKDLIEKIANLVFLNDGVIHTINLKDEIIEYKEKINDKEVKKSITTNQRLILTYSSSRAKKDKVSREKEIKKAKEKLINKNIKKSDLKLNYIAKYITLKNNHKDNNCNIEYQLNQEAISLYEKLDGIKGFITNDFTLSANDVIAHYQYQYDIEKAFRISKTDLRIRPIYHRLNHRIKAHILISFVSYAIYKEFERRLKLNNIKFNFSQKLLRNIIKHMFALKQNEQLIYLKFDEIQQKIYDAIHSKH